MYFVQSFSQFNILNTPAKAEPTMKHLKGHGERGGNYIERKNVF